jgi:hypothetical protein
MKLKRLTFVIFLAMIPAVLAWITSCRHDSDIMGLPDVCFETEVLPVFLNNCTISGCHSGSSEGMNLTDYTSIMRGVTPGKPYSSQIYKAITSTFGEGQMPPGQPLTLENRTLIMVWIEQGALNKACLHLPVK